METARKPGRPRLTDEQAWKSLRKRFEKHLVETPPGDDGEPCLQWVGPATLEIAGDRGVISPTNFALAEMGKNLNWFAVVGRNCATRLCMHPDHLEVVAFLDYNAQASWTPNPIPPL